MHGGAFFNYSTNQLRQPFFFIYFFAPSHYSLIEGAERIVDQISACSLSQDPVFLGGNADETVFFSTICAWKTDGWRDCSSRLRLHARKRGETGRRSLVLPGLGATPGVTSSAVRCCFDVGAGLTI
jgi:hypothetical protein